MTALYHGFRRNATIILKKLLTFATRRVIIKMQRDESETKKEACEGATSQTSVQGSSSPAIRQRRTGEGRGKLIDESLALVNAGQQISDEHFDKGIV